MAANGRNVNKTICTSRFLIGRDGLHALVACVCVRSVRVCVCVCVCVCARARLCVHACFVVLRLKKGVQFYQ